MKKNKPRLQPFRYLLLVLVLIWAATSIVARTLLADIDQYRPRIEQLLRDKTPYDFRIEEISGRWLFYTPVIEIQGLSLNSKEGEPGHSMSVFVDQIIIELDLLGSVFSFSPRFKRLLVDAIGGSIDIESNEKPNTSLTEQGNWKDLLNEFLTEYILSSKIIEVRDSSLEINSDFGNKIVSLDSLSLSNKWFVHNLSAELKITEDKSSDIELKSKVVFSGSPFETDQFSSRIYLQAVSSDLSPWLDISPIEKLSFKDTPISANIWIDLNKGVLESVVLNADSDNLTISMGENLEDISSLSFLGSWEGGLNLSSIDLNDFKKVMLSNYSLIKFEELSFVWKGLEVENLRLVFEQEKVVKAQSPLALGWDDFERVPFDIEQVFETWGTEVSRSHQESKYVQMRRLVVNTLNMDLLNNISAYVPQLDAFEDQITKLDVAGELSQLQAIVYQDLDENNPLEVYASLYGSHVGISSFKKIPAINGADFYLELAPSVYGAEVLSENIVVKKHDNLFREDITIDSISGDLLVEKVSGNYLLHSNLLHASNEWADAQALLTFTVPQRLFKDGTKEAASWSLALNAKPISHKNLLPLSPGSLPIGVLNWLDASIKDGFFSGDLFILGFSKKQIDKNFFLLDALVDGRSVEVDYLPGQWPAIKNIDSTIKVHSTQVIAEIIRANVYDSRIVAGRVEIPSYLASDLPRIKINGEFEGGLKDVRTFFLESDLKETFGEFVMDLELGGQYSAKLGMDFSLLPNPDNYKNSLNLESNLSGASLNISSIDLQLEDISSKLAYSFDEGLSSPLINGMLFNKPFTAKIETLDPLENPVFNITGRGEVDAKDLQDWQSFWVFDNLQGSSTFNSSILIGETFKVNNLSPEVVGTASAGIEIGPENRSLRDGGELTGSKLFDEESSDRLKAPLTRVDIMSDFKGMSLNFPGEFSKAGSELRDTHIQLDLLPENSTVYRVNYEDRLGVSVNLVDNHLERARVNFGRGSLALPLESGLSVTGRVDVLNYEEWMEFIETNLTEPSEPSVEAEGNKSDQPELSSSSSDLNLNSIDLSIGTFMGFDQVLVGVEAFITREELAWRVDVNSPKLKGFFVIPDEGLLSRENPILAKLDYLEIDSTEKSEQSPQDHQSNEELTSYKPSDFMSLSLDVDNMVINKEKHGRWQVDFSPSEMGLDFDIHQLNYGLLTVNGKGYWDYSPERSLTSFEGHLRTRAVTKLFSSLNLQPSSSSAGLMSVTINWPGSPLDFDTKKLKGKAGLKILDGSIVEVDINSKKFRALGIFNLGILTDIFTLKIFKKIGDRIQGVFSKDEE